MDRIKQASRTNVPGPYLEDPYVPQEVDDVTFAFPARIGQLTPDPMDIPDEFWKSRSTWNNFVGAWFSGTLPEDVGFLLKPGIVGDLAIRHLSTILRSYQPKHEHKEAAVAYLSSRWFHAVVLDGVPIYGEVPDDFTIKTNPEEQA